MAGFFGFFDYTKAGKGVEKDEYEPRIKIFFDVFFRRFWKLIQLNMLYCICSLPLLAVIFLYQPMNIEDHDKYIADLLVFSSGALLYLSVIGLGFLATGFSYVLRNFSRQSHAWVASDFFEHIKKNFKQASLMFIIDTVVVYLFSISLSFYSQPVENNNLMFIAKVILIIAGLIYFMMHFYIYQIMVTFKMSLKQIIRNSLILTLAHLPQNIMVAIIIALVAVITFSVPVGVGAAISFLISVSLIGYIVNFMAEPIISRYMIEPLEDAKEQEESICVDTVSDDRNK